jgi:hypothetical protein
VSCERVLVSIVMKCAGYAGSIYIVHVLEALHQGEAAKIDSSKKYYFHRLADEYIGHTSVGGAAPRSHIFVGAHASDTGLRPRASYIRR